MTTPPDNGQRTLAERLFNTACPDAVLKLLKAPRWVCWKYEQRKPGGKPTKVPYRPNGRHASSTKSATWSRFRPCAEAVAIGNYDGVGVVLGEVTPERILCGIDLDLCRDPNDGAIKPWAQAILERFRTYGEVSPSGEGIKLLFYVTHPIELPGNKIVVAERPGAAHHEQVEVYTSGRYFTVTGRHHPDTPDRIADGTAALEALVPRLAEAKGERSGSSSSTVSKTTKKSAKAAARPLPTKDAPLPAKFAALLAADFALAAAWEHGRKLGGGGDTSASGLDYSLAIHLAHDLDDDELAVVLARHPHGQIGNGTLNGEAAERRLDQLLEAARERREDSPPSRSRSDLSHDALALAMGEAWQNVRYVATWGSWLFWDGTRWKVDDKLEHMTRARTFLRQEAEKLLERARAAKDPKAAAALEGMAKNLRSAATVANVVTLARSNPGQVATVEQWDADPWLLGTPGGTIDLRTGELKPADPADHITMQTAVAPAPPSSSPP